MERKTTVISSRLNNQSIILFYMSIFWHNCNCWHFCYPNIWVTIPPQKTHSSCWFVFFVVCVRLKLKSKTFDTGIDFHQNMNFTSTWTGRGDKFSRVNWKYANMLNLINYEINRRKTEKSSQRTSSSRFCSFFHFINRYTFNSKYSQIISISLAYIAKCRLFQ